MLKKTLALLLALIFITSTAGCVQNIFNETESEQTQSETEAPEEPLVKEKVTGFDCFSAEGISQSIVEAGKDRVAILSSHVTNVEGDNYITINDFFLLDLRENKLLAQNSTLEIDELIGIGNDGEIVGINYEDNTLKIYDSSFKLFREVTLCDPLTPMYCASDMSTYLIDKDKLVKITSDGEKTELCYMGGAMGIELIDPLKGVAIIQDGKISEDLNGLGDHTAYNYLEGKVQFTLHGFRVMNHANNSYWVASSNPYTDILKEEAYVSRYDDNTGRYQGGYKLPMEGFLSQLGVSGYGMWCHYNFDITDKETYMMLDLINGKAADLTVGGYDEYICESGFLFEGRYFACLTSDKENKLRFYIVDPELMDYSAVLEGTESGPTVLSPDVSPAYEEEIKVARRIEKEYSVRILIGEEEQIAKDLFYYELVPTEAKDKSLIMDTLEILEYVLSLYPENFIETFRNYRNEGGLRFILVKDFRNKDGEFIPGGVALYNDGWYNIAVDIDAVVPHLVHHEIWHATEDRIIKRDRTLIDMFEWAKFNPEGFSYNTDFDNYTENRDLFKMVLPIAKSKAYFVDTYSTITGEEDRATLIEEVLSENYDSTFYGYPDSLTMIRSCPKLNAKLEYLSNAVKEVFGTVYWEDILAKTNQ